MLYKFDGNQPTVSEDTYVSDLIVPEPRSSATEEIPQAYTLSADRAHTHR